MAYTDPVVDLQGRTRDEHLAVCEGCRDLRDRARAHLGSTDLTCYELHARAIYAIRTLSVVFTFAPGAPGHTDGPPTSLPRMADAVAGHLGRGTVHVEQ